MLALRRAGEVARHVTHHLRNRKDCAVERVPQSRIIPSAVAEEREIYRLQSAHAEDAAPGGVTAPGGCAEPPDAAGIPSPGSVSEQGTIGCKPVAFAINRSAPRQSSARSVDEGSTTGARPTYSEILRKK